MSVAARKTGGSMVEGGRMGREEGVPRTLFMCAKLRTLVDAMAVDYGVLKQLI